MLKWARFLTAENAEPAKIEKGKNFGGVVFFNVGTEKFLATNSFGSAQYKHFDWFDKLTTGKLRISFLFSV